MKVIFDKFYIDKNDINIKEVIKFLLKPRIHIQEKNKRVKIYFDNIGDISRFINEYNEIFFGFITKSELKIEKETWK
jgi:hypothetical protein